MPELPEVEVVRRDLDREVVGKKIKAVDVDGMRSVRRHHNRKQFTSRLVDHKITGVERRGKYLLCRLDGDDVLVIHLGMSGQLLRAKSSRDTMAKHTHVVITFTQGGQLRFVDPRTFGEQYAMFLQQASIQVLVLACSWPTRELPPDGSPCSWRSIQALSPSSLTGRSRTRGAPNNFPNVSITCVVVEKTISSMASGLPCEA